jgi:hypothetical protein
VTGADLEAWFARRRPTPPPLLQAHLARVAGGGAVAPLPDHLAEAGHALLERVASRPQGGRELALDLLAADALVTYAFEAQAEADTGGLVALAQRLAGSQA